MKKLASKMLSPCQFEWGQVQCEHLCLPSVDNTSSGMILLQSVQLTDIMALTMKLSVCSKDQRLPKGQGQTHLMSSIITFGLSFAFCPLIVSAKRPLVKLSGVQ